MCASILSALFCKRKNDKEAKIWARDRTGAGWRIGEGSIATGGVRCGAWRGRKRIGGVGGGGWVVH